MFLVRPLLIYYQIVMNYKGFEINLGTYTFYESIGSRLCSNSIKYNMASETGDAAMDAYLPGAASLVDQLDSKIFTILRDGRNLVGILRSFDQYLNLVLEETFERVACDGKCVLLGSG